MGRSRNLQSRQGVGEKKGLTEVSSISLGTPVVSPPRSHRSPDRADSKKGIVGLQQSSSSSPVDCVMPICFNLSVKSFSTKMIQHTLIVQRSHFMHALVFITHLLCDARACCPRWSGIEQVGLIRRTMCFLLSSSFPVKREQHNQIRSWLLLKTNDACQHHARATSLLLRAVDATASPIRVKQPGTLEHFNSWRYILTILITEGGLPGNTLSAKRWYYKMNPY